MATVMVDMAIGIDGSISDRAGGDGGLHDWYFDPAPESQVLQDELLETTGAMVMGRATFDAADQAGAWEHTPFQVPHLVVTHHPRESPTEAVDLRFRDDLAGAVDEARSAAGDRVVVLSGGGDIVRQCLDAGLVDELQLHVVPLVLGGPTLFGGLAATPRLSQVRVVQAPTVTHLRYRVDR